MHFPKRADLWLPGYLRALLDARRERARRRGPLDILFCVADHYEPLHGNVSAAVAAERVRAWVTRLPALAAQFRDGFRSVKVGAHAGDSLAFTFEPREGAHRFAIGVLPPGKQQ